MLLCRETYISTSILADYKQLCIVLTWSEYILLETHVSDHKTNQINHVKQTQSWIKHSIPFFKSVRNHSLVHCTLPNQRHTMGMFKMISSFQKSTDIEASCVPLEQWQSSGLWPVNTHVHIIRCTYTASLDIGFSPPKKSVVHIPYLAWARRPFAPYLIGK